MKITDITFGMLRVPLKTPFKTALRTVATIEDIVVMVHTDSGRIGYGEAPATAVITGDTHGSIVDAIRHYIAPRLIGQDIGDLNRLTRLVQTSMEKNTSAKAAVEIAIYDLWGQLYDAPLYKLLGGGDPAITTDITISVDYIDKMVADIPDAQRGVTILFSSEPFPGYQHEFVWLREEYGGNWYAEPASGREGWLCPAMFAYFDRAPQRIFAKVKPKPSGRRSGT